MKFRLLTEHPVAVYSQDHIVPGGTMHDNSRNSRFNKKLYRLLLHISPIRICDLGCAGGGFVKDCLDDGHVAIGIEGSDYSTKWDGPGGTREERELRKPGRRAEWATIPDNLFTADITKPFEVTVGDPADRMSFRPAVFDVFTAWEVMEHLHESDLPVLCDNVRHHLAPGGIWVMSVSEQPGDYHVCVNDRRWWLQLFDRNGFRNRDDLVEQFDVNDWVRGPNHKAPMSFHLILSAKES